MKNAFKWHSKTSTTNNGTFGTNHFLLIFFGLSITEIYRTFYGRKLIIMKSISISTNGWHSKFICIRCSKLNDLGFAFVWILVASNWITEKPQFFYLCDFGLGLHVRAYVWQTLFVYKCMNIEYVQFFDNSSSYPSFAVCFMNNDLCYWWFVLRSTARSDRKITREFLSLNSVWVSK